jgi:hypothetical protein
MFDWLTGETRLFGIVGDPISQVRSPQIVTEALQTRGINAVLAGLMQIANLGGLILTLPYKARGLAHVDHLGPEAQAGGGINAMRRGLDGRWQGEIFDGLGCLAALAVSGVSPAGNRVLLVGAGGAGAAIVLAVAHKGPASRPRHRICRWIWVQPIRAALIWSSTPRPWGWPTGLTARCWGRYRSQRWCSMRWSNPTRPG